MKVHLLFPDRDFSTEGSLCFGHETLSADLELQRIINTMSRGDGDIAEVCAAVLFSPLTDLDVIAYRREAMEDALRSPQTVRRLYEIIGKAYEEKRKTWYWISGSRALSSTFTNSIQLLKMYLAVLRDLRSAADDDAAAFASEAFRTLFAMLREELGDDYFERVQSQLDELQDKNGTLVSVQLGRHNQGVNYVLRRKNKRGFLMRWTLAPSYTLAPKDEMGAVDLEDRRNRAINEVTNALAQSAEHLESFLSVLQRELAFYIGGINLSEKLKESGMPVCMPVIGPAGSSRRSWSGLYDVSLALAKGTSVTSNDMEACEKKLFIITGANQGGKTTFLRSMGQAQLMAQCGLFVGAAGAEIPLRTGVFTHFKKEEDAGMKSGKLDEELTRMERIADHLESGSMMLFNESFAATNEREGSEICRQITAALNDNGVEIFSVTHLYTYAAARKDLPGTQYLRAQRLDNGERTFRIVPGEPQETAYGRDLYIKVFGTEGTAEKSSDAAT